MSRPRNQATIETPVSVTGFGYWSGLDVTVQFLPAPANSGIVFVRDDISDSPEICARVGNRTNIALRTSIQGSGCQIDMIEHIMSALAGLKIDNCEVVVDQTEMPGMDGSCDAYVQALLKAGRRQQAPLVPQIVVTDLIRVETDNGWIEAKPVQGNSPSMKYSLDFPAEPAIGRQEFQFNVSEDDFAVDVAPARTFITSSVAEMLKAQGMGSRVTYQDLLVFSKDGPIENEVRFENECARHKLLDLIGDLALSGHEIIADIHSCRGGHALNAQLVRRLLNHAGINKAMQRVA